MNTPSTRRFGRGLRALHALDFAHGLPRLGRLPMALGQPLGEARGWIRARLQADWRSLALGHPHVAQRTLQALHELAPDADAAQMQAWLRQRFAAEARDELEARWIAEGRCGELHCRVLPDASALQPARRGRGLVLLTAHWRSFFIGIGFLARQGARVNVMTSAVTSHPLVVNSVADHFRAKYRGLATFLNGGQLIDFEGGLRPFFRMLERGEIVVVLADAPVLPNGARLEVPFLGARRALAGGAVRMAEKTDSDLGAFVCAASGPRHYTLALSAIGLARERASVEAAYRFLSDAILRDPGGWWAADLLPDMPPLPDTAAPVQPVADEASLADASVQAQPYGVVLLTDSDLAGSAELDFGVALLRRTLWGGTPPAHWVEGRRGELPAPAMLLEQLRAHGCRRVLVFAHPALLVTAVLPQALDAALAASGGAAVYAVAADQRQPGALAPTYVTQADFEQYVAGRQALPAAQPLPDGARVALWLDIDAALASLAAGGAAGDWNRLDSLARPAVLAPRAYVHDFGDYRRHERADMLAMLPQGIGRLLDVGGGEGAFARAAARERGVEAWLLEPDPAAAARARAGGLSVIEARLEDVGDGHDGRFDVVTLLDVLEHLDDPRAGLAAIRRLLRPAGMLLVSTPNVGHWPLVRDLAAGRFDYLPVGSLCWTHLRFFTEGSLRQLLRDAGFEVDLVAPADGPAPDPGFSRWVEAAREAGLALDQRSLAMPTLRVRARAVD